MSLEQPASVVRFGTFEVDLCAGELRKQGVRIKLQEQPFLVLKVLLGRPGETVAREELRSQIWSTDTFVDFDNSLNTCINKLREALGDSADSPRFIETVPRRGYRFVAPTVVSPLGGMAPGKQHRWVVGARVFAVLVVLGAAGLGVYSLSHRPAPTPFQNFTITQITHSGKAARAAISPDGRYVLSVTDDNGMQSLWLRNVPTGSDTQVIPPSASQYEGLAFSPDGNYIYFRKALSLDFYNLYRSPILGGTPQTIEENIDSDIAFSPDGRRIAYMRNYGGDGYRIYAASLEGNNETVLQTKSHVSEGLLSLAWNLKGDEIYYSILFPEQGISAIEILDIGTSKSHRLVTFKDKILYQIHWSPDGRALFVNHGKVGWFWNIRGQIGLLRGTGGDIDPITRDTNQYTNLTLSADGRTLATVMARSYATISVLSKAGREFGEPRPLLSQVNEFNEDSGVRWSADGNLLVSNYVRLLKLGADGKNQAQLLADSSAAISGPSSCGTNYLVLSWIGHGGTNSQNIWRTNPDGSSPLKLTNGRRDLSPVCSPDQKWVYYADFVEGQISRVPLDGSGKTEAILGIPEDYSLVGQAFPPTEKPWRPSSG